MPWRIAGALVLLFGQPAERIAGLTIGQVKVEADEGVLLNPAEDWIDVPEPLATPLRTYLGCRRNMATAANPDSVWLFPGGMPGRHIDAAHIASRLRSAGVPVLAARMGTWCQLFERLHPAFWRRRLASPRSPP